jgi:hypothetical protein
MGAMISGGGWSAVGDGLRSAGQSILQYYKMKMDEQDRQDRIKQQATENALRNKQLEATTKQIENEAERTKLLGQKEEYDRFSDTLSRLPDNAVIPGALGDRMSAVPGLGAFLSPETETPITEYADGLGEETGPQAEALRQALAQPGAVAGVQLGADTPTGNYKVKWGLNPLERIKIGDALSDEQYRKFMMDNARADNWRADQAQKDARAHRDILEEDAFNRNSQSLLDGARRSGLATWRSQYGGTSGGDAAVAALLGQGMPDQKGKAIGALKDHIRKSLTAQVQALRPGSRLQQFYTPERVESILDDLTYQAVEDARDRESMYGRTGGTTVNQSGTTTKPTSAAGRILEAITR